MSISGSSEGLFLLGDDLLRVVLSFLGVDMALPFACVSKSALRVTLLASGGELRTRKECFLETRDLCVYSREVGLWDKMVVDMSMRSVFCFCAEKGLLQGLPMGFWDTVSRVKARSALTNHHSTGRTSSVRLFCRDSNDTPNTTPPKTRFTITYRYVLSEALGTLMNQLVYGSLARLQWKGLE